jgi:aminopeptidase-like protein/aminoglycoside N3'-acetyltransferase
MSATASYTREDFLRAIRRVGISPGDVVFFHLCLSGIGTLEGCKDEDEQNTVLFDALLQAVGPNGTLVVPTYTFSFCRQELFDVQQTPTNGGPWSTSGSFLEYVRRQPSAERSRDPIHSVCAIGPRAAQLVRNLPNTCFGADSVHDRLRRMGGKVCMIGVGLEEASFQHHVEEMVGVPFRFKKLFTGIIRENNIARKSGWIFNVHLLAENGMPDGHRVDLLARTAGIAQTAQIGAGEIISVDTERFYQTLSRTLVEDPWFTAQGPAADPVAIEEARVGGPSYTVKLPANASMSEMIESLWELPRDIVSDGYDAALRALAEQLPMTIHEYPSGTECSTWIVPEKWTCHEAWLETLDGKRLFSYADHPLHVVSYSLPFEGEVSREELLAHLHVHPLLPDAVPFIFKYYERDWGLCCSRNLRDSLTEERYRVRIRTSFSYDTLKVGEVVIPGASDETIVLCAHLCHPHMVNDDLSGVVVGMDVMRQLLERKNLRYTYRFLIVPETIGSISYLAANGHMVPKMVGGLFLEMLGLPNAPALQHSITPDTEVDRCFEFAVKERDPQAWVGEYREIIGNDERQFNSPGFRVPMLSLSRVLPRSDAAWPYPEYHSSHDTPVITSQQHLEDSRDLVLRMLEVLEQNTTPINLFEGELFCSRYGIHVDAYENPEGNRALFRMLDLIDGTRSVASIARACGVQFRAVRGVIDELIRNGVVSESSNRVEETQASASDTRLRTPQNVSHGPVSTR